MNYPEDEFIPPKEKVVERPTHPWGRFTAPMENDADKFREGSSRNKAFSPRGGFCSSREKITNNFISLREKTWERHIPLVILVFPRGGPGSPRYKMMSPLDKFTSPKDMVGNKHVFSRERVI